MRTYPAPQRKLALFAELIVLLFTIGCTSCGTESSNNDDTDTHSDTTSSDDSDDSTDTSSASADADTDTDTDTDSDVDSESELPDADELTGNETTPSIDWMTIEHGTFTFGSPADSPCRAATSENEVTVTLTRSFQIASTEITQAQWTALDLPNPSWSPGDNKPVTVINFLEALVWCNKLSRLEGLEPCYNLTACRGDFGSGCIDGEGNHYPSCGSGGFIFMCNNPIHNYEDRYSCPGYRLPTSPEWEYAAKAGVTDTHTYGGDLVSEPISACNDQPSLNDIAWYCFNSDDEAHDVAQKLANPWGLYDTLGNVYEWVDYYFSGGTPLDYQNPGVPMTDPVGPPEGSIEIRGSHFSSTGCLLRPTDRLYFPGIYRSQIIGFRPVRTIFE